MEDVMFRLLKNAKVYAPGYLGRKDILLAGGTIMMIDDRIDIPAH